MRYLFALIAALLLAVPVQAQVVDTITVDVFGEPTAIDVEGPLRGYVGDTLTFSFEIVDSAGNPSMGVAVWDVEDPTRANIVAETDSTISVALLRPGRLTLQVTIGLVTSLRIGGEWLAGQGDRTGQFRWQDEVESFTIQCPNAAYASDGSTCAEPGPALQLCAVGYSGERPVLASNQTCIDQLGIEANLRFFPSVMAQRKMNYFEPIKLVPLNAFKNVYPTGIPHRLVMTGHTG